MRIELHDFSWDRMIEAVQAVRERALRATAALEQAGIPYCVAGGNAVAAWVARVDRAAVRNTQDVDILVRRSDLDQITVALEAAGSAKRTNKDGGGGGQFSFTQTRRAWFKLGA
jgi:hypothetical protein